MSRIDIEQIILIIWTFIATTLDLYNSHIKTNIFYSVMAFIVAAIIYYIIGLIILTVINSIHRLIKGGQQ